MPVSHAKTCSDCCVRSLKYALSVALERPGNKQQEYLLRVDPTSAQLPIQAQGRVSGIVLHWKRECAHEESRLYCVQLDY